MKVKGILLCLAFVVALSYSVNAEDYDHVTDLEVSGQPCVDETLTVTWTAFDQSHSATLRFNPGLFHPDSDVDRSAICPYLGEFGSAVFLDGELHKLYTSTSEHFEVERTHHFFNRRADTITADGDEDEWQRRERMLKTPGSHFVMTRTHSAQQDDARCGSDDIAHPAHTSLFSAQKKKTATARSQSYPSLPSAGGQLTYAGLTTTRYSDTPPSSCPQGTSYKAGSLAFVSDYSFYQIFNSLTTTQAEITALAQWVSVAFSNTLHVQLNLVLLSANVRTSLDSSSSTLNWNDGTCSSQTTSTILDRFTSWRASQTDYAVYHLLTKCWASGNVGLAWTGVVCTSGSPVNGNGPGLFSNTGVSSYLPGNGHLVSTHEIGHGFGAPHDDSVDSNGNGVGGIMTSCFCSTTAQPTLQEFSQLSQNAMASTCTKTCLTTGVNPGTSSTSSSSTTVATTVATAATTVTVAPGSSEQTQILAAVNNLRASYGVSSLTWSTAAANYAASGASACNWNALSSSSASYGVYWSASYPQATGTALSLAQSIVASKSAYTCSTDTCASSTWCSSAFRAFISSTTTGVACVSQACAAGTNSPWGTGVAWNLVACAASPYQVYSGQHPTGVTCPASKVVDEKCAAACGDRNCGTVKTDACGEVTCGQGDCDALGQCIDGYCACTPLTTCASRNVTCGRIVGNCGQRIVCNSGCDALGSKTSSSSASSSERDASSVQSESSCVAGTADLLCGQRVCGSVADGCGGTVTCGACRESSYCDDDSGACLVCDATCHPLGSCIRLQDGSTACQCPVGYSGDGVTCVQDAQPVPAQSCSAQSWTSAFGSAAGFFFAPAVSVTKNVAACNIAHEDTGSSDGLLFSDWTYSVDGGDAFWSVAITRQSGDVGLIGQSVVDNDSKATVFSLRYEAGHQALYFTVHGRYGYSKRLKSFAWPAGDTHVLTAVFRSSGTIVATLDDELLEGFEVSYLSSAQFGIVASGNALFTAAEISLASAVQLTVSGCWTEDAIVSYLAQALYIDPSLISATVTCIDGSSDVTIYIDSGSSSVSALGAAAMLKQKSNVRGVVVAANPAAITGRLSAVMKTGAVVQGTANGVTPVYYAQAPLTAATAGGSGGLSGGAIAGIVIGSVAGAALILGGGAYLIARNKRHEDHDTDLGAAQEQPRPKSWRQSIARINPLKKNRGVNVMEHDPTKHMSITGRNPNISQ